MKEFKAKQIPDFDFKEAVKKPLRIKCVQVNEPFTVETLEGTLKGKSGDWLMIGVEGEMYAIDDAIFKKTYNLVFP